ncbi:MAG: hypothetical protein Q4B60_01550 [Erysipelotrichaceae bacterium]|nr:hypothetical protein [Erysipelotrichaceae bacterium]
MRLIKSFDDDNNFYNAIVPLTIDISEVVFVYSHDIDVNRAKTVEKVIRKHKDLKITFKKVNEETLYKLLDEDCLVDISASKYISIILHEAAIRKNLTVLYFDRENQIIRNANRHENYINHVFNFKIEDIITLGGGKIISHLHKPIEDDNTRLMVNKTIEYACNDYPSFIALVSKINSIISSVPKINESFILNDQLKQKIICDENYLKFKELNLFTIEDNELIFYNKEINELFKVSGSFLENYIYQTLVESKIFDDVLMSVTIEFGSYTCDYPVRCELDALVLKDNKLIFTSIKSNKVEVMDLNEIKVHNVMFGNQLSKSLICTMNDLNKKRPGVYAKAEDLGVYIIDQTAFLEKTLTENVLSIINGTYKYETI